MSRRLITMPRPYSKDLRERIVRAVEGGMSRRAAAQHFAVSVSFVIKLLQRWNRRRTIACDQFGGYKTFALAEHREFVHALVARHSEASLDELCVHLAQASITVSRTGRHRFLRAEGLTRKKRRLTRLNRNAPMSRPLA